MERVWIGMIGCRLCGESHLRAYQAGPGAVVAAGYDPASERARELAEAFRIPRVCS